MKDNNTAAHIAWRYLKAKKSHGAVSAIAVVSVVGVAVAVAATICVLSVFNGFSSFLSNRNGRLLPDIEITAAHGKTIAEAGTKAADIVLTEGVEDVLPVLSDQALAIYDRQEMPVRLLGADLRRLPAFLALDSIIYEGGRLPRPLDDIPADEAPEGLVAVGVAANIRAYDTGDVLFLFTPRREGQINTTNPAASFQTDSIAMAGVFESGDSDFDSSILIVPEEVARGLFMYDDQATSLYVRVKKDADIETVAANIRSRVGKDFDVRTRREQQYVSFRMVNIEKWVTFLLLIFILLIASFNIISTMTMLVLEKRHDMKILTALGMTRNRVGNVFAWESVFVTLTGAAAGILLGVALTLCQQHFGLITMSGSSAAGEPSMPYPVELHWLDIPVTLVPVFLIGLMTAVTARGFAKSRI